MKKLGRKAYKEEDKRKNVSISLSEENIERLKESSNRSKLIGWLIDEYFESVSVKGEV